MENMTQLLCLYTSKRTSFFTFLLFLTYFRTGQEECKQPIKQRQYQFRSQN